MADEPRSDEVQIPALAASIVAEAAPPRPKWTRLRLWHLIALVLVSALVFALARAVGAGGLFAVGVFLILVGSWFASLKFIAAWTDRVAPFTDRLTARVVQQYRLRGWLAEIFSMGLSLFMGVAMMSTFIVVIISALEFVVFLLNKP